MKPVAVLLAAGAVALGLAMPARALETLPFAPNTPLTHETLPNGLEILLLPIPSSPVTTMHTWVKAGSRDEKPGITGIAHLFEHMMFRPVNPGEQSYFDRAAALGMDYNASTRFNCTDFYDTFQPGQLGRVSAIEAHRFQHLHVTKQMIDVEREAVRSEYSTKFDAVPIIDLWFWVYHYAFPGHPYGWQIIGEREDLDRITAEDCNRFFQANYKPNQALIAIAGPIDPQATLAVLRHDWANWAPGPAKPAWNKLYAPGTEPVVGPGKLASPSKNMLIGYRTPERTGPDRLAQDLAEEILFDGKDSLVAKRLIDQKHIASTADAFNTHYDIALAKVLVLPNPGVPTQTIYGELQAAIAGFRQLPDADYAAYRQAYAIALREHQLKTHDVTSALGRAWAYDGNFRDAYRDPIDVLNVPRAAVQAVIDQTYRPENRVTAITPDVARPAAAPGH